MPTPCRPPYPATNGPLSSRRRPSSRSPFRSRSARRLGATLLVMLITAASVRAGIDEPVTPRAQPGVRALLQLLDRISGRYILSGQQELGWDPRRVEEDIDFIKKHTGRSPVVRGFDFGDYLLDPGAPRRHFATERAIAWAQFDGVVTFSCHMPMAIGAPPGKPQFYSPGVHGNPGTTFDLRQALVPGTPENGELLEKMDLVAAQLQRLRDTGVVVIWRPFHECSGGWFWWGRHGAAPFKQVWRLMFERYTRVHQLDNLLWCYNPTDSAEKMMEWYPGDDVVDLISLDVYPKIRTLFGLRPRRHPTFATEYQQMRAFRDGRKVVAMSENGPIPDPDRLFAEGAGWSYFLTWNQFVNDPAQNPVRFLKAVYDHPKVVTLDEYPPLVAELANESISSPGSER